MSSALNRIVRSEARRAVIPSLVVATSFSCNQGDLLCLDTSAHQVILPTGEGQGSTFLGISEVTVISGKVQGPYQGLSSDAARAAGQMAGPVHGVVANLLLKSGDTFSHGALVYLDPSSSAQGVQASGTKAIGVYVGSTVTATTGSTGDVMLTARYPGDIQHA